MGGKTFMKKVLSITKTINSKFCFVGIVSMLLLMVMVTIDTITRRTPIGGITDSMDMTQLFLGMIIYGGMAFLESERGHVRVDMFLLMMPKLLRRIVEGIIYLLSTAMLGMVCFAYVSNMGSEISSGAATQVLGIPQWPFKLIVTIGLILFAITFLIHTIAIFTGHIVTESPEEDSADDAIEAVTEAK